MILSQTQRLNISVITLKDAPFFVELMNTPHFKKYIGDRNINSIQDAEESLKNGILKSYDQHGFSYYKLQLKSNPEHTIGIVGLLKREYLDHPDIGFAFLPEFEGQGYGYEASMATLQLAKTKFNMNKVCAITQDNNANSIKLIEKLGLTFEKRVKPLDEDQELLLFAKNL